MNGVFRDEQITTCLLLGDRVAGDHRVIAGEHRQVPRLQVPIARVQDRGLPEHRPTEDDRDAGVGGTELLERHRHAEHAQPQPAELCRNRYPVQADRVPLPDQFPVEVVRRGLVELLRSRQDHVLCEVADGGLPATDLGGRAVKIELEVGGAGRSRRTHDDLLTELSVNRAGPWSRSRW